MSVQVALSLKKIDARPSMLTALCNTDIMHIIDRIGQEHWKGDIVDTSDKEKTSCRTKKMQ